MSSGSEATSGGAEPTGTSGVPGWPQVACGEVTCLPGEFCIVDPTDCSIIDDPCESEETTGGRQKSCIHVEPGARHCAVVPPECEGSKQLERCLEDSYQLCPWLGEFTDGVLECQTGFGDGECGFDGPGPYAPYCSECEHETDGESDDGG